MKQKIACHKGKCWEIKEAKTTTFDDLFESHNLVEGIEKDLWHRYAYGN